MITAVLMLLPLLAHAAISPSDIKRVVAFGDSLSDNGNLFKLYKYPEPPYFNGRFSDGPVWVEYLAVYLQNASLEDYAFGGATANSSNALAGLFSSVLNSTVRIPDLAQQLEMYTSKTGTGTTAAQANDLGSVLFTVLSGANDFFESAALAKVPDANGIAGTLVSFVARLVSMGATKILVAKMPPLEATPSIAKFAQFKSILQLLVSTFNEALTTGISKIAADNPKVSIVIFDTAAVFNYGTSAEGMKAFELTNTSSRCLSEDKKTPCSDPHSYLFWDDLHPTTKGHAIIAQAAYNALTNSSNHFVPKEVNSLPPPPGGVTLKIDQDAVNPTSNSSSTNSKNNSFSNRVTFSMTLLGLFSSALFV
ncbi:GDSL-like Lipase/Acylhydrolase-domain-containing protein [Chytriomyces cf. hyalinus JEL632]|nr:GDSL-like Lipase/Acylhydrolase-domain-containing protein [Chytriomyces cf. hyalinus JEL632]